GGRDCGVGATLTTRGRRCVARTPSLCVLVRDRLRRARPGSPLLPYTTLFRSRVGDGRLLAPAVTDWARKAPARTRAQSVTAGARDRKSTRLNSSHGSSSYAVSCLKKKKQEHTSATELLLPSTEPGVDVRLVAC